MKKISSVVLILILVFMISCTRQANLGRVSINDSQFINNPKIALINDLPTEDGDHMWAMQSLTHSFILQKFKVTEYLNPAELSCNDSCNFKCVVCSADPGSLFTRNIGIEDIKKFGELLNVDYIVFYGFRHGEQLYLRFVECKTAKVAAVVTYEGDGVMKERQSITDVMVEALVRAAYDANNNDSKWGSYGYRIIQLGGIPSSDAANFIAVDTLQQNTKRQYNSKALAVYPYSLF